MAEQIQLGFSVNTAQLTAAEKSLQRLNTYLQHMGDVGEKSGDKVARGAKKAADGTDELNKKTSRAGMVAFQAGQAVQDFAIGFERGLGPAIMYAGNNLSFIASMMGVGGAFGIGLQVATTGVMLLAQNWEKLGAAIDTTRTPLEKAVAALGVVDAHSKGLKDALSAAAAIGTEGSAADARQAAEFEARRKNVGGSALADALVAARTAGMSPREIVDAFDTGVPVFGKQAAGSYDAFAGDPGMQDKLVREAMARARKLAEQDIATAGTDSGRLDGLIGDLRRGGQTAMADKLSGVAEQQNRLLDLQVALGMARVKRAEDEKKRQDAIDADIKRLQVELGQDKLRRAEEEKQRQNAIDVEAMNLRAEIEGARVRQRIADKRAEEQKAKDAEARVAQMFAQGAGSVPGQWLAQQLRAQRMFGANDAEARANTIAILARDLQARGEMGQGPRFTRMESMIQARRMVDEAMPEAKFWGQQMDRAAAAMPPHTRALALHAEKLDMAMRRGIPFGLGNRRRAN